MWKLEDISDLLLSQLLGSRGGIGILNWSELGDACIKRWGVVWRWLPRASGDNQHSAVEQFQWVSKVSIKALAIIISTIEHFLPLFDQSNQCFGPEPRLDFQQPLLQRVPPSLNFTKSPSSVNWNYWNRIPSSLPATLRWALSPCNESHKEYPGCESMHGTNPKKNDSVTKWAKLNCKIHHWDRLMCQLIAL